MVMIAMYVDDCLTIGTEESIEEAINARKRHNSGLKVEYNLTDYLNYKIVQERDKEKVWIMQPDIIDNLENKFGGKVNKIRATPHPERLDSKS
jgi:hypothetical protein